jgi:polyisoprenoid-binding protein YceI
MSQRCRRPSRRPGRIHGWWTRTFSLCVALSGATAARGDEPGEFRLREGAGLYARIYRDPSSLLGGYSHDHVLQGSIEQASLRFDPDDPSRCRAQLRIAVLALEVDEPSLRQKLGLTGTLDAAQRESVREHLLAEDQLDARRHPSIEVAVQGCVASATPGRYVADAAITIHGKTQKRPRAVVLLGAQGRLSTRGSLRFTHADFGMKPYSAWLGGVRNLETIDLLWALEAEPVVNVKQ